VPQGPLRTSARRLGGWAPTAAHQRAILLPAAAALAAVLGRRPDLLVLVAPLVVAALWGQVRRPTAEVSATAELLTPTLREGEATGVVVRTEPVLPEVHGVVTLARVPWIERKPQSGIANLDDGKGRVGLRGAGSAASVSP
jgi:hypothetical protein